MARLGTPENPEVIEPGAPPSAGSAPFARVRTLLTLVRVLAFVLTPALIFDAATLWLVREGWHAGNPLAWLLVLVIGPAAALSTLLALLGVPVVLISMVFLVLGRSVSIGRFDVATRFGSFR